MLLQAFMTAGEAHASGIFSVNVSESKEVITLRLPVVGKSRVFTLSNPERLVIDIPLLDRMGEVKMPPDYKGTMVKAVRTGKPDAKTTRIVLELNGKPASLNTRTQTGEDTVITVSLGKTKDALTQKEGKPVVVIDAGHGGQDPGTQGPEGTQEKEIVLEYAHALRKQLLATGRYRVVMTRADDRFILLRERVNLGRKAKGQLFISLHADSAPERAARGLSVYTLSEKASDAEADALAQRENKADILSDMDFSDQSRDVADILISLAQRDTNNQSAVVAGKLVASMDDDKVRLLQNSHRFAGFAVLKAPDIPSVLVEIGFLSHPEEEKLLKSKPYRDRLVRGLTDGIDAYFNAKKEQEGRL